MQDLLDYKKDIFTQNGEDGIIEATLGETGAAGKVCCEFLSASSAICQGRRGSGCTW